jgi:hypothetical protein
LMVSCRWSPRNPFGPCGKQRMSQCHQHQSIYIYIYIYTYIYTYIYIYIYIYIIGNKGEWSNISLQRRFFQPTFCTCAG